MSANQYEGSWTLIPELCIYESGEVPVSGKYSISETGGVVAITTEWTTTDGTAHSIEYGGPVDGSPQASDAPGVSKVVYQRIDKFTLDSTAYNDTGKVMYARRKATEEGALMSTVQVLYHENVTYSNFQVYRKVED